MIFCCFRIIYVKHRIHLTSVFPGNTQATCGCQEKNGIWFLVFLFVFEIGDSLLMWCFCKWKAFLEYLALLLPSVLHLVQWLFYQAECVGHVEEVKLNSWISTGYCSCVFCKGFSSVACELNGKMNGNRSLQRRVGVWGLLLFHGMNDLVGVRSEK